MKRELPSLLIIIYGPVLLALLAATLYLLAKSRPVAPPDLSAAKKKAAALEARGLYAEALEELEHARTQRGLLPKEEAELLYKMAKTADEKLNDCARALPYYTMAAALQPEASWAEEADRRSVICLEKTGRSKEAAALLNQLTAPGSSSAASDSEAEDAADPVVAVIDGRSVYWSEVAAARGKKGEEESDSLESRQRDLKEYILTRILAAETVRKGYDLEPGAKGRLEWARTRALADYYLDKEYPAPPDSNAMWALLQSLEKLHEVRIFTDAVPAP